MELGGMRVQMPGAKARVRSYAFLSPSAPAPLTILFLFLPDGAGDDTPGLASAW